MKTNLFDTKLSENQIHFGLQRKQITNQASYILILFSLPEAAKSFISSTPILIELEPGIISG
jgi:hypothetical protein